MKKAFWIALAVALIFLAAFGIRYLSYQDTGITLDEPFYVKGGLYYVGAAANLSFFSQGWSFNFEHPPVSKYIYGVAEYLLNGGRYDYNAFLIAKAMSIACGALTCVLVYLIGRRFFSEYVGILAAFILAFTPMFIAHGQLSNIDSPVTLLVTATMYAYMEAVKAESLKLGLLSALLLGLSLGTKYNALLIVPVMAGLYLLHRYYKSGAVLKDALGDLIARPPKVWLIALSAAIVALTFYAIWPYLWPDPIHNFQQSLYHWTNVRTLLPEDLLGGNTMQGIPIYYYPLYFLVTTPEVLLLAMAAGLFYLARSRDAFKMTAALWLFLPFAYAFSNFVMGSMRYILMIYPALSLVCAYGIYSLSGAIGGYFGKYDRALSAVSFALGLAVVLSLVLTCLSARPYYLDYYNSLSGGYQNIHDHRLFLLSWWGEGLYDPVRYVEANADHANVSVVASGVIGVGEYVDIYAKNNTYAFAGGMDPMGGYGPPGIGNMSFGPPADKKMDNGFMPPAMGYGMGRDLGSPGLPMGGSPGMGFGPGNGSAFGPAARQLNMSNVTADYIIMSTGTGMDSGYDRSNYSLVYQSKFHGVPLYDVLKRVT